MRLLSFNRCSIEQGRNCSLSWNTTVGQFWRTKSDRRSFRAMQNVALTHQTSPRCPLGLFAAAQLPAGQHQEAFQQSVSEERFTLLVVRFVPPSAGSHPIRSSAGLSFLSSFVKAEQPSTSNCFWSAHCLEAQNLKELLGLADGVISAPTITQIWARVNAKTYGCGCERTGSIK